MEQSMSIVLLLVVEILGETYEMVGVLWAEHQPVMVRKTRRSISTPVSMIVKKEMEVRFQTIF